MLSKCHWIVLYTVHFTAFCLGGGAFFPGHGVYYDIINFVNKQMHDQMAVRHN